MPEWIERVRRSALAAAIGSNLATQLAVTFAQVALVPVFVTHWGPARYGSWLLLFTIPGYLAMADLGLASAAANDMTARVARGDLAGAADDYRAIRMICGLSGAAVVAGIALFLAFAPHSLDVMQPSSSQNMAAAAMLLSVYGALALQNGVTMAGLRSAGGYALSGYVIAATMLGEATLALVLVATGADVITLAGAYLLVRLVGSLALKLALHRRAPWLRGLAWRVPSGSVRPLVRPALAMLVLSGAQAFSIHGTVLVIGATLGVAAVPVFTVVRTLSRIAIQAILLVNHAIMPAMTMASAVADRMRIARYIMLSYATAASLALVGAIGMVVAGRWLINLWTGGTLHPPLALIVVMAVSLVLNALWQPASNLILAINRHEAFSWFYLVVAGSAVAACFPLIARFGITGVGVSLVLVDVVMTWRIAGISRRLRLLDWPTRRIALDGSAL